MSSPIAAVCVYRIPASCAGRGRDQRLSSTSAWGNRARAAPPLRATRAHQRGWARRTSAGVAPLAVLEPTRGLFARTWSLKGARCCCGADRTLESAEPSTMPTVPCRPAAAPAAKMTYDEGGEHRIYSKASSKWRHGTLLHEGWPVHTLGPPRFTRPPHPGAGGWW